MNKRKGLSLIEVLVSMVLLTIVLASSVTVMTNLYVMMSEGKQITRDSFDGQMTMENALLNAKAAFTANVPNRTLFNGTAYQTTMPIQHVQSVIANGRTYNAYISNTPILTLPSPSITAFSMDSVVSGTTTRAFPWIEDNIQLRGNFTLAASPQVYETRTRWYKSPISKKPANQLIWTPIFSSQFDLEREIIRNTTFLTDTQTINKADLEVNSFYHFEIMPYTLPGKITQRINENRIAILNKTASTRFNSLMESAYFGTATKLNTSDYPVAYLETMNNAERATLHIDSNQDVPKPGSITGMSLADISALNKITITGDFQFDPLTYASTSGNMIAGFMIGDVASGRDTGHMLELNTSTNSIDLDFVQAGAYKAGYSKNTQSTAALNNANFTFDWTKAYSFTITIDKLTKKLELQLTDADGNASNKLSYVSALSFTSSFLGIKAYSPLQYNDPTDDELLGPYARNFTLHLYSLDASGHNVVPPDQTYSGDYFLRTGNITIAGDTQIISGNSAILIQNPTGTQTLAGNNVYRAKDIIVESNITFSNSSILDATDNVYIKGNVIVDNGAAAVRAKQVYIRGNVSMTNSGSIQASEDLIIDGNLSLSNAGAYLQAKRIYVTGTVTFTSGAVIYATEKLSIKGFLALDSWSAEIISPRTELESGYRLTALATTHFSTLPVSATYTAPAIGFVTATPIPTARAESWYTRDQSYFNNFDIGSPNYQNRIPALANNRKIVTRTDYVFPQSGDNQNVDYTNVVVVSLNGNISINLSNKKLSGIFFAPNGNISLSGIDTGLADQGLQGYFISKGSMTVSPNNVGVVQVPLSTILGTDPVPFIQ